MPLTANILRPYMNPVFVETGTYSGDGVAAAIDAGFLDIRSVERSEALYRQCVRRFGFNDRVRLYWGNSSELLWDMLAGCMSPITFWLDAHYSGDGTVGGGEHPLLAELAELKRLPSSEHTILIDDANLFGTGEFPDAGQINGALLRINPDYYLKRIPCHPGEALVAIPVSR